MTLRAVVVGSGSAGRRHANAIWRRCPDAEIVVVRRTRRGSSTAFEALGATMTTSIAAATRIACDLAIVASPATLHRADAEALANHATVMLIEKPLAATVGDAEHLADALAGRPVVVGYHLRWSETVRQLASTLVAELPGPIDSFDFSVGQHLSQWRPGTDPGLGVSARHELGGGVLLELSHELDAVGHLLGPVHEVLEAELRTDGAPTDGVVDTVADLHLELRSGVTGRVHLDMTSDPAHRRWSLTSGDVAVVADLLAGTIHVRQRGTTHQVHRSTGNEREAAEDALIGHLLAMLDGVACDDVVEPGCTIEDGLATLRVVAAAHAAAEGKRRATVSELSTATASPQLHARSSDPRPGVRGVTAR